MCDKEKVSVMSAEKTQCEQASLDTNEIDTQVVHLSTGYGVTGFETVVRELPHTIPLQGGKKSPRNLLIRYFIGERVLRTHMNERHRDHRHDQGKEYGPSLFLSVGQILSETRPVNHRYDTVDLGVSSQQAGVTLD